jgi:hypothetical protein
MERYASCRELPVTLKILGSVLATAHPLLLSDRTVTISGLFLLRRPKMTEKARISKVMAGS